MRRLSPETLVEPIAQGLDGVIHILKGVLDIVDERVDQAIVPSWCERRGWGDFLLGLGDADLLRAEQTGLLEVLEDRADAPPALRDLAADVLRVTRLPSLAMAPTHPSSAALRSVSERKQAQLGMLLAAIRPMAKDATRIVDVGAGSGHFARLAAGMFGRTTLGLEINPERVEAAKARMQADRTRTDLLGHTLFVVCDACDARLGLVEDDLAVGLHACGELGDRLVTAAAEARCSLALVSCCLQKIRSALRPPLARATGALRLRKEALGLTNLTPQAGGIENTADENLRARETRYALGRLLRARGVGVPPGAEMRGINRRRAQLGLAEVSGLALTRLGLTPATPAEIREHETQARRDYAAMRRLSLPRNLLGRLIEVAVAFDRAQALEDAGLSVRVALLTHRAVTPRNIVIFASRSREQLPKVA